jgi:rubredoxin
MHDVIVGVTWPAQSPVNFRLSLRLSRKGVLALFPPVSFGVQFPRPLVRAVCFMRAKKVPPANWRISKDRASGGWGCSECGWVFHPHDPPVGKSLDEMKRNFQMQLSEEFASHSCEGHPRAKIAKLSS